MFELHGLKMNIVKSRIFVYYPSYLAGWLVSLEEAIKICLDKFYALPDSPKLPRPVLKDFLVFCSKKSHFVFDGQYFDQIDGVAMGSSLDPVLANSFIKTSWRSDVFFRERVGGQTSFFGNTRAEEDVTINDGKIVEAWKLGSMICRQL